MASNQGRISDRYTPSLGFGGCGRLKLLSISRKIPSLEGDSLAAQPTAVVVDLKNCAQRRSNYNFKIFGTHNQDSNKRLADRDRGACMALHRKEKT